MTGESDHAVEPGQREQTERRSGTAPGAFEPETAFDILRNARRREALAYLLSADSGSISLGALSEQVAASEYDVPVAELTSAQRKRVYVSLYQSHLPRMDEADVVTFDQDRGTVRLGPNAEAVGAYLSTDGDETVDHRLYGVVSLVGGCLLVVGLVTPYLPGWLVALVLVLAVATLSLVGMYG